jgi:hypothetical protein
VFVHLVPVHLAIVRTVRTPQSQESLARECLEPGSLDGEVNRSDKWLVRGCLGKTAAAIERALGRAIRSALRRG